MSSIFVADWIKNDRYIGDVCPVFFRDFSLKKEVKSAVLMISALGVYEAKINGKRVGDFIFAPGWTSYKLRVQFQSYDVTQLLTKDNIIEIGAGIGWRFHVRKDEKFKGLGDDEPAVIAMLNIDYADGSSDTVKTGDDWLVKESAVRYSHMYNGETFDANFVTADCWSAKSISAKKDILLPQQGEEVHEMYRIPAVKLITTPKGETVIDFGQDMTGYVEFKIKGKKGENAVIHHAEVLDRDGNFYTENYRSAKSEIRFICDGNEHTFKPHYSFQGFRYIRLEGFSDEIKLENFTAVVVFSDMKRIGSFECSDAMINKLYGNIIWGQRSNFLDVPTDCPQRDERMGWTGDAQVFVRTASYNYDVERFFSKWLADLAVDQDNDGPVPHVVPKGWDGEGSAAWADVAVIAPWQIYLTYGSKKILKNQYVSMKRWIDYMKKKAGKNYLWDSGTHFGDWLSLDDKEEATGGGTDHNYIAQAFFAYSTSLFIKACKVIGEDASDYEELYPKIIKAFRKKYIKPDGTPVCETQTACVLALYFDLVENRKVVEDKLVELVKKWGHLTTGFVGTPYLMHVLTSCGRTDIAYDLLFRKEYPSWLYPITQGATTMWERWNGQKPDGSFCSAGMNSFNHYAYGAVGDWLYGTVAGINTDPDEPGFRHIIFKPVPDKRLTFAKASIVSRFGLVESGWSMQDGKTVYEFTVPAGCTGTAYINGEKHEIKESSTVRI